MTGAGTPSSTAGSGLGAAGARGDGAEDRVQPPDGLVLAADHQAVTAVQAEYAARRAAVQGVDLLRREPLRPDDVVPVVRVPAVDHGVTGLQQLGQLVQG